MRVLEEKIGYAEQVFRELATMTERVYAIYEPIMACVKQANGLLRSLSTKSREIEACVKGNVATMNALISPVNAAVLRLYEKFPGLSEQVCTHGTDGPTKSEFDGAPFVVAYRGSNPRDGYQNACMRKALARLGRRPY